MSVVATVRQLKEDLAKCNSSETDRLSDILRRLDEADVNLGVLTNTMVGASVSKLKANPDPGVAERAKALVKKWKKCAKEGQAAGGGAAKKPALKRGSSASAAAAAATSDGTEKEWAHLPPLRKNICSKFHSILDMSRAELTSGEGAMDDSAIKHLGASRAMEMEGQVQKHSRGVTSDYKEKARSLVFNLKKNGPLREAVLFGGVTAEGLCKMSPDELATSDKAKARAKMVGDLQDSRRLDWEQANEARINEQCGIKGDLLKASLFTCGRCKSIKTTSTQKQTRSADEPMTVFVFCLNCGNRWKC